MEKIDLTTELSLINMLRLHGVDVSGVDFVGDCVDVVVSERYLSDVVLRHLTSHFGFRLQSFDDGRGGGFRIRLRRSE